MHQNAFKIFKQTGDGPREEAAGLLDVNGFVVAGHGHVIRSQEEGVEGETLHCCILCVWRRVWLLHILYVLCVCVSGVEIYILDICILSYF